MPCYGSNMICRRIDRNKRDGTATLAIVGGIASLCCLGFIGLWMSSPPPSSESGARDGDSIGRRSVAAVSASNESAQALPFPTALTSKAHREPQAKPSEPSPVGWRPEMVTSTHLGKPSPQLSKPSDGQKAELKALGDELMSSLRSKQASVVGLSPEAKKAALMEWEETAAALWSNLASIPESRGHLPSIRYGRENPLEDPIAAREAFESLSDAEKGQRKLYGIQNLAEGTQAALLSLLDQPSMTREEYVAAAADIRSRDLELRRVEFSKLVPIQTTPTENP